MSRCLEAIVAALEAWLTDVEKQVAAADEALLRNPRAGVPLVSARDVAFRLRRALGVADKPEPMCIDRETGREHPHSDCTTECHSSEGVADRPETCPHGYSAGCSDVDCEDTPFGRCSRCKGNGRIEMLEHCPQCGGTGEGRDSVADSPPEEHRP